MKTITAKIIFYDDDGLSSLLCCIEIPEDIPKYTVEAALQYAYNHPDDKLKEKYDSDGYIPETLLDYVCKEHRWTWTQLKPDITLDFDDMT